MPNVSRFHPEFSLDVAAATEYYDEISTGLAGRLRDSVKQTLTSIRRRPEQTLPANAGDQRSARDESALPEASLPPLRCIALFVDFACQIGRPDACARGAPGRGANLGGMNGRISSAPCRASQVMPVARAHYPSSRFVRSGNSLLQGRLTCVRPLASATRRLGTTASDGYGGD